MTSFRELRVWQAAMALVERIYKLTYGFPREEVYGLSGQVRRAAVSIPSSIAEGHTREHLKEYLHHLSIAQGSLAELDTQMEIAVRLKYISQSQLREVESDIISLGKQMYALRNALRE